MGFLSEGIRTLLNNTPTIVPGSRFARVISVTTRKGGVGKTTVSLNLAAALAEDYGKKVLLVDLDPQGHTRTSTHAMTSGSPEENFSTLLLDRKRELIEAAVPSSFDHLYMVHADDGLNEAENLLSTRMGKEFSLRNMLRLTRTHFDIIILDTPPNLGNLTIAGLAAADFCLLPLDLSPLALQGIDDILDAMDTMEEQLGHHVDLLGLVVNRFDKRLKNVNESILGELEARFGDAVMRAYIPSSSAVSKAQLAGQPLISHDPKGRATKAFNELAADVLRRIG